MEVECDLLCTHCIHHFLLKASELFSIFDGVYYPGDVSLHIVPFYFFEKVRLLRCNKREELKSLAYAGQNEVVSEVIPPDGIVEDLLSCHVVGVWDSSIRINEC